MREGASARNGATFGQELSIVVLELVFVLDDCGAFDGLKSQDEDEDEIEKEKEERDFGKFLDFRASP